MTLTLVEITDAKAWDEYVAAHPAGHPLQLWGWGEAKRGNGWTPHRLALLDGDTWLAGVQVLVWQVPRLGSRIAYAPRGPVAAPGSSVALQLLQELEGWAKQQRVMYARVEPAWRQAERPVGWRAAGHHIQLPATYTIDLNKTEEVLQEPMARKHRQYIRKSERDGVSAERLGVGGDIVPMYQIYSETAARAGFGLHAAGYYERLFAGLGEANYLYYAYFEGRPVAFLWLAVAGKTAYELYGGVNETGQAMKANYLLKWRAITELKAAGYEIYDFNGRLNEGVSQFKQGFGPDETDYVGTWDFPVNKAGYTLWEHLWPVVKPVGRRLMRVLKPRQT